MLIETPIKAQRKLKSYLQQLNKECSDHLVVALKQFPIGGRLYRNRQAEILGKGEVGGSFWKILWNEEEIYQEREGSI